MQSLVENPLATLLRLRQARKGADGTLRALAWAGVAAVGAIFLIAFSLVLGAPEEEATLWQAALGGTGAALGLIRFLFVPAVLLVLVGLPCRQVQNDALVLASFVKGRCLAEVLGTRTRPCELLDGVALHSAVVNLRTGWKRALMAAATGLLLFPDFPDWWPILLTGLAAWAPLALVLSLTSSYLAQMFALTSSSPEESLGRRILDPLTDTLFALPMGLLTAAVLLLPFLSIWGTLGGLAFQAALGWLARGVSARRLVRASGADRGAGPRPKSRPTRERSRWVRPWSENPIVMRECARDAAHTPPGVLGFLLWRHGPAVLGLAGLAWLVRTLLAAEPGGAQPAFWLAWGLLGTGQWMLAANRTSMALVEELERKTLDSLLQTTLRVEEFIDGWVSVGTVPRTGENALLLGPLLLIGWSSGIHPLTLGLACLVLLAAPCYGAHLGVYASVAPNRQEAQRKMSGFVAGSGVLLLIAYGILVKSVPVPVAAALFQGPSLLFALLVALGLCTAWCRLRTRRELSRG